MKLKPWIARRVPASANAIDVAPEALISANRFDLGAKLPLARQIALGQIATHSRSVYIQHLLCWNGLHEIDPPKLGAAAYLSSFAAVVRAFQSDLGQECGALPLSQSSILLDGSHRASAAIALGKRVPVVIVP